MSSKGVEVPWGKARTGPYRVSVWRFSAEVRFGRQTEWTVETLTQARRVAWRELWAAGPTRAVIYRLDPSKAFEREVFRLERPSRNGVTSRRGR